MDKVARINSIDFHSAEAKAEFRKGFIEFQKDFSRNRTDYLGRNF